MHTLFRRSAILFASSAMPWALAFTIFAAISATTTPANAQGHYGYLSRQGEALQRRLQPSNIFADVGFFYRELGDTNSLILRPSIHGIFPAGRKLGVALDWGFAFGHFNGDSDDEDDTVAYLGNPFVGVYWFDRTGRRTRLRLGGGIALPVSLATNDGLQPRAGLLATAMQGLWNPWLWLDTLGFAGTGRFFGMSEAGFFGGIDFGLGLMFDLDDTVLVDATELAFQFAGDVGYDWRSGAVGLRLQGVWIPTQAGDDDFQFMLGPFVKFTIGGGFGRVMFTMNLDDPYGSSFDDNGVYGLWFTGGKDF